MNIKHTKCYQSQKGGVQMKSVTISQDLCHIVAKAGRNNEQKWLPLWMHARDTAEVMKYLIREWLPESVAKLLEKAIIQQKKSEQK